MPAKTGKHRHHTIGTGKKMNRGFRKSQKKHVNKMTHEQDEQSDDESDEDTVHVLSVLDSDDDGYWVTP